jgi:uncharacterized membrane protein YkvA (DUF1232 family)
VRYFNMLGAVVGAVGYFLIPGDNGNDILAAVGFIGWFICALDLPKSVVN